MHSLRLRGARRPLRLRCLRDACDLLRLRRLHRAQRGLRGLRRARVLRGRLRRLYDARRLLRLRRLRRVQGGLRGLRRARILQGRLRGLRCVGVQRESLRGLARVLLRLSGLGGVGIPLRLGVLGGKFGSRRFCESVFCIDKRTSGHA